MNDVTGSFTEDQLQFATLAAKAFGATAEHPGVLGDAEVIALRSQLADLGAPLLAVPEQLGGAGLAEPDVVLVIEEAGFAGVPVEVVETLGVVAPMLARFGSAEQQAAWLSGLARGEILATTICPQLGAATRARPEIALLERAEQVHLVELPAPDTDPSTCPSVAALGEPETAVAELCARSAWVTSAYLNGMSRRLLALSVEYAGTREQFGVAIGSFQAVKHILADVAAAVESARPTAWRAARALAEQDPAAGLLASAAKARATRAAALANDHALQVHGGIGFTREHPLHRWLVDGHELQARWGDAGTHEAALGSFAVACDSLLAAFAS
jgi:alkylation response protein AidB-like acyl-CoA dehydrogenase